MLALLRVQVIKSLAPTEPRAPLQGFCCQDHLFFLVVKLALNGKHSHKRAPVSPLLCACTNMCCVYGFSRLVLDRTSARRPTCNSTLTLSFPVCLFDIVPLMLSLPHPTSYCLSALPYRFFLSILCEQPKCVLRMAIGCR